MEKSLLILNRNELLTLNRNRVLNITGIYSRVEIIFKPRKHNKAVDKLAKTGKKFPIEDKSIAIHGLKTAKRLFDGKYINYSLVKEKNFYSVYIYRKEPVKDQWQLFGEILDVEFKGHRINIFCDNLLERKLQRQHAYKIRIRKVYKHHVEVYSTMKEIKKYKNAINND